MMAFFKNFRIRFKLLGVYTMISILATLLSGAVIYYTVQSTIETNIENELTNSTATIMNMVRTVASTSIKNHLRAVAENNKEIIQHIYADYKNGLISEKAAKKLSQKILLSQTIGKTGYIFCSNTKGIAIVHPNPGVAGKNFMDHGFVKDMIRLKEGYLEYDWKNPEDEHKRPKALYMTYFEPWDWILGVSSYREEFKELIEISDFKESILSIKFGKTGYAYILDSTGSTIVHPFLSGNYYDVKDKDGNYFIKRICTLKNGKLFYFWKNPQETIEREKLVIFNYIPEYDWIIASASYLDEIFMPLKIIKQIILTTVFLIIVLVFLTSFWVNSTVIKPLKFLMNRLSIGASGNLAIRMPVKSADEIGQLANYFNEFMEKLEKSRQLENEILHISEKERQKIAMELHDDLCPQLIGIEVLTKILKKKLETKAIYEAKDADTIRNLIMDSIDKTRRLSRGLFPVNLSEHGLETSLKELAGYISDVFGISCKLNCNFPSPFKESSMAVHLYYIAHEAVHNAVKHAKADQINIILTDNDEKFTLTIKDNGKGLNNNTQTNGMGMKIMKYRAARIRASFNILEGSEKGTLVIIKFNKRLQF